MIINNQSNVNFSYTLPDGTVVSGNQPSNIVPTEVISDLVTKVKSGDKTFLRAGETSVHTVIVTNNSTTALLNPVYTDLMGAGASHVAGTVTVNGISQPTYDPVAGFPLPNLAPGASVTLTFTILADTPVAQTSVTDVGQLDYAIVDPISGTRNIRDNTNPVNVVLIAGNIVVVKSVDRAYAISGDTLHYTSVVTNTGNVTTNALVFFDPTPAGTVFVAGSVSVNGVSQPASNPAIGFPLLSLAAGASATVEFNVTVI